SQTSMDASSAFTVRRASASAWAALAASRFMVVRPRAKLKMQRYVFILLVQVLFAEAPPFMDANCTKGADLMFCPRLKNRPPLPQNLPQRTTIRRRLGNAPSRFACAVDTGIGASLCVANRG